MKKYKLFSMFVISSLCALSFPMLASANSSWVWISETRPYDILPFVVIGTLLIETVAVNLVGKINNWYKSFFAIFTVPAAKLASIQSNPLKSFCLRRK